MRRLTAIVLGSWAFLLCGNPAIAQSSSGFERAAGSFASIHYYVAGEAIPRQLAAPPNLKVADTYRPLVDQMLRDSPTFRRQCLRIAGEPSLTVQLTINPPGRRSESRATTRLSRDAAGHLTATVEIRPYRDTEELIAHEFEHIIEQLDGVDLAARAALPDTGVKSVGISVEMFETIRAKRVGMKVVAELER